MSILDGELYRECYPPLSYVSIVSPKTGVRSLEATEQYVAWIQSIQDERLEYTTALWKRLGFETLGEERARERIVRFEEWIQELARGAFVNLSGPVMEPLTGEVTFVPEGLPGHDPVAESLALSLAHDIAFFVTGEAANPDARLWITKTRNVTKPGGQKPIYIATVQSARSSVQPVLEGFFSILGALQPPSSNSARRYQERLESGLSRLGRLFDAID
jgi:hypothetical protein